MNTDTSLFRADFTFLLPKITNNIEAIPICHFDMVCSNKQTPVCPAASRNQETT